jgi:hypothetical protein
MSEHELRQRRRTFETLRNAFLKSGYSSSAKAATLSMIKVNDALNWRMWMRP